MTVDVLLICLEIFVCRIVDVSCATIRMVLTIKEKARYAALIGFLEAFLWFVVVRNALSIEGGGVAVAIAYAAGFATGTFIGGKISSRFIKINITCQIVTSSRDNDLVSAVRAQGYGLTVIDVNSSEFGGEKYLLFCEIPSTRLKELKTLVHGFDDKAFFMVQETKHVFNGFVKQK